MAWTLTGGGRGAPTGALFAPRTAGRCSRCPPVGPAAATRVSEVRRTNKSFKSGTAGIADRHPPAGVYRSADGESCRWRVRGVHRISIQFGQCVRKVPDQSAYWVCGSTSGGVRRSDDSRAPLGQESTGLGVPARSPSIRARQHVMHRRRRGSGPPRLPCTRVFPHRGRGAPPERCARLRGGSRITGWC